MNNTLLFPINFAEIAVYKVQKRTDKHYFKNTPYISLEIPVVALPKDSKDTPIKSTIRS